MSRLVQTVLLSIVVGVVAVVIVAYVSAVNWFPAEAPMRWMALGAMIPAIIAGILIAMPQNEEPWTPRRILAAVLPGVLIGGLGVAVGAQWKQPEMRASVLDWVGSEREGLLLALEDPSAGVVWRACRVMMDAGVGDDRSRLLSVLTDRPRVAEKCLAEIQDPETAEDFGITLANRWHRQLVQAEEPNENACLLPTVLADLPVEDRVRIPILLSCSLRAVVEEHRTCCATALSEKAGQKEALTTRMTEVHPTIDQIGLTPLIVAATFGTGELGRDTAKQAEELGLRDPAARRAMIGLACDSIDGNVDDGDIIRHLTAWAASETCGIDPVEAPSSIRSWRRICEQMRPALGESDSEPHEILCSRLHWQSVAEATEAASELVAKTLSGRELGGYTKKIEAGFRARAAHEDSEYEIVSQLESYVKENPAATAEEREMLGAMREIQRGGGNVGLQMLEKISGQQEKLETMPGAGFTEEQKQSLDKKLKELRKQR